MPIPCPCTYCSTFSFVWKLPNNTLWVEIPRNGSLSVKSEPSFSPLFNVLYREINQFSDAFWFMRHPVARFKSLLSEYFFYGKKISAGKAWINNIVPGASDDLIPEIVCDYFDDISKLPECHLWDTQASFVPNEVMELPTIKAFDVSFLHEKMNLPYSNQTDSHKIDLPERCIHFIQDFYCDDYEMYGSLIGF